MWWGNNSGYNIVFILALILKEDHHRFLINLTILNSRHWLFHFLKRLSLEGLVHIYVNMRGKYYLKVKINKYYNSILNKKQDKWLNIWTHRRMYNWFKLFSSNFFVMVVDRNSYFSCSKLGRNRPPKYWTHQRQVWYYLR